MASKHEAIVTKLRLKWSAEKLGRLFLMRQGKAVPLHSDYPVDFGSGVKGFPDIFGWTNSEHGPIFTVIEVKTRRDTIRPEQKDFLNYAASQGVKCYIAKENDSPEGYGLEEWTI